MVKHVTFLLRIALIALLVCTPLFAGATSTVKQQIATIYKKNPGKKNLYTRLYLIKQLSSDLKGEKMPVILQKNAQKITKNTEAYHLYRIAAISILWQNGFIKEAYKLSEELQWDENLKKDKQLLIYLYNETANLYFAVSNDSAKAKDYHLKSMALNKEIKDTVGYQSACINTAQMCYQKEQFKEGDNYLKQAKKLEKYGFTQFHAYIIMTENSSLMLQNKNNEARNFMLKNKDLLLSISPACYHVNLGMIDFSLNNQRESESNLLLAERLAKQEKNTDFYLKSVKYLSKLYDQQNRLDLAYKFGKLRDSVQESTSGKAVKNTIDSLKLVNAQKTVAMEKRISNARLAQSKQNQFFLIIGLIVITFILGIVTVFLIRIRNKNKTLVRVGMNASLHFEESVMQQDRHLSASKEEAGKAINYVLAEEINEFLVKKKNYRLKEISLQYLSKKLKSNQHDISETINGYYGITLPNLLNKLRIHDAMKLLADDAYKHYSIEGISREVGYESISTFNRNFKEIANVPPSFFQKEALKLSRMRAGSEIQMERA